MTLDLTSIKRKYLTYRDAIRSNTAAGLPVWTRGLASSDLLSRPLIFVDTENFAPAFDFFDRNANIAGIVNDYKVGQTRGRHQIISSADIVKIYRANPQTIFINSTVLQNTQRFFNRIASQNDIPTLSLLELHRLLRIVDGIRVPIRTHGLLEMHDLLGFFDVAVNEDFERIEQGLNGEFSKVTLYALLLQRLTGDTGWHLDVSVGGYMKPYGIDSYVFNARFFQLANNEVYVDAGAYRGDTIALFAEAVGNSFEAIYAFEPDDVNFLYMQAAVGERLGAGNRNIHLHRTGLWDSQRTMKMRMSDGDGRTRIGNHFELEQDSAEDSISAATVDVVTLDEALDERHISFLKLEIEGAELQALRGGRNVIRSSRPKIALSNYHRARDLIELFNEIESLDAGYKINFVHHRESLSAGVYYCVPPP